MGVLFEKRGADCYRSWYDDECKDELSVADKISDIIVTHSRISVLLYDCIVHLSRHGGEEVNDRLEAATGFSKGKSKKENLLSNLRQNLQDTMRDKECPYTVFWQQIAYYADWCANGQNWDIIQRKLRLHSLRRILHILMAGIGIEEECYGNFALDLLEMNDLRNRVAHGDIAVRLAAECFNKNLPSSLNKSDNVFTDVSLIYECYMLLAEKWKIVLDTEEKRIIQELGGVL